MTPAGVGFPAALASFAFPPAGTWLAAESGGAGASLGTLVGVLLYASVAVLAIRFAVRRAEDALTPREDVGDARRDAPSARS